MEEWRLFILIMLFLFYWFIGCAIGPSLHRNEVRLRIKKDIFSNGMTLGEILRDIIFWPFAIYKYGKGWKWCK